MCGRRRRTAIIVALLTSATTSPRARLQASLRRDDGGTDPDAYFPDFRTSKTRSRACSAIYHTAEHRFVRVPWRHRQLGFTNLYKYKHRLVLGCFFDVPSLRGAHERRFRPRPRPCPARPG
jgi:hypothetical protein